MVEALDGQLNENQRWMLGRLLEQVGRLEKKIDAYSERIEELMSPYQTQLERLDTIGGVGMRSAENILAEIGPNMDQFPTDQHSPEILAAAEQLEAEIEALHEDPEGLIAGISPDHFFYEYLQIITSMMREIRPDEISDSRYARTDSGFEKPG